MKRAAIYARRSTTEHQAASLDVQVEEARRWCASKGFEVVATYLEDGVSRAEFVNRPALGKLLVASSDGAFEALVMRDDSRLGGDLYRTGMVLQELADAGVEVWYHATNERVSFDDPTAKLMSAVRLYASEVERLKITGRVREHLENRARKGQNVGGKVYGYRNVRTAAGVHYEVDAAQAEVVREIFDRHARGEGIRTIAKALNDRGVPAPRAGSVWIPSGVHSMLRRERYRGVLEWGRVGGEYKGGTRRTIERPVSERIRVERPDLAIVSAELWQRAQARVIANKGTYTQRFGQAPAYLLTGLGRCEACGGPIHAATGKRGRELVRLYVCGYHADRGRSVCPVSTRRPVEVVDAAVLDEVKRKVLSPAVVDAILCGVREAIETDTPGPDAEVGELTGLVRRLEGETARLASAYASQGMESLLTTLRDRETRLAEARARLDALASVDRPSVLSWPDVEAVVRSELEELNGLLLGDVGQARAALKSLLRGDLLFRSVALGASKAKGTAWEVRGNLVIPGGALLSTTPMGNEQWERPFLCAA